MFAQQRLFLSFFYISYKTRSIDHGATEAYTTRKKIHADSSFRQSPMIRKLGRNFVSSWRKRDEGSSFFYYYACKTVFTLFVASSVRSLLRDSRLCTQASYFFLWVILNHAVHFDVVTIFICPLDGVSLFSTRVTSIVSSGNDYSSHCDKNLFLNWQFNGLFFFFLNDALKESIVSNWVKYRVSSIEYQIQGLFLFIAIFKQGRRIDPI